MKTTPTATPVMAALALTLPFPSLPCIRVLFPDDGGAARAPAPGRRLHANLSSDGARPAPGISVGEASGESEEE